MKTLPDNPNLDHLRRQAKDLLAGLRDTHPDASLADAQASLAEQYGFRTWTDLKAEVDRRRGHGRVADPALARADRRPVRAGRGDRSDAVGGPPGRDGPALAAGDRPRPVGAARPSTTCSR